MAESYVDVVSFWFDTLEKKDWYVSSPELDARIKERFGARLQAASTHPVEEFLNAPLDVLGAVLLFDQLSRNIHRGTAEAFAFDPLALSISERAISLGIAEQLPTEMHRHFLYMPYMHSESLEAQDRALELFGAEHDYAIKHRDMVVRFGRFPHRNEVLGRESTADELEYLKDAPRYGQ